MDLIDLPNKILLLILNRLSLHDDVFHLIILSKGWKGVISYLALNLFHRCDEVISQMIPSCLKELLFIDLLPDDHDEMLDKLFSMIMTDCAVSGGFLLACMDYSRVTSLSQRVSPKTFAPRICEYSDIDLFYEGSLDLGVFASVYSTTSSLMTTRLVVMDSLSKGSVKDYPDEEYNGLTQGSVKESPFFGITEINTFDVRVSLSQEVSPHTRNTLTSPVTLQFIRCESVRRAISSFDLSILKSLFHGGILSHLQKPCHDEVTRYLNLFFKRGHYVLCKKNRLYKYKLRGFILTPLPQRLVTL
jgi:hypothetical protein